MRFNHTVHIYIRILKYKTIRLIYNTVCKICFVPYSIQIIVIAQEHAYTYASWFQKRKIKQVTIKEKKNKLTLLYIM